MLYLFLCNLCINGIYCISAYDLLFDSHVHWVPDPDMSSTPMLSVNSPAWQWWHMTGMLPSASCYNTTLSWPLKVWTLHFLTWLFSWLENSIGMGNKLYCSNWAVVKLSCVDTTLTNLCFFIAMFSHVSQTLLVLISYAFPGREEEVHANLI